VFSLDIRAALRYAGHMDFKPGAFSATGGSARVLHLPPTFALVVPLLRRLGLTRIIDQQCPIAPRAEMTHGQVVEALIMHLLQDDRRLPMYQLQQWAEKHNLCALYGAPAQAFNDDRIGRTLDALAPMVYQLHALIVTAILSTYQLPVRAVLWDLTHILFQGAYEQSELIEAGYGHGGLHDKQIQLSLHAEAETGLPLLYKELPGATNQTPLAGGLVEELKDLLHTSDLIVVSDKAGVSYENILAYRRAGAHFVSPLQTTPAQAALVAQPPLAAFTELEYRAAGNRHERFSYYATTVTLQRAHRPGLTVSGLLIHSTQKQRTDAERRDKAIARALAAVAKVTEYLNRHRYFHRDYAQAQLDKKIRGAAQGIVGFELSGEDGQLSLRSWVDEPAREQAAHSDGRYLLIHNLEDPADEIFKLYKRQYVVEHCFRSFKSTLRVNPVWLHKQQRITALVLIWVLALTIFVLLGILAERVGLDNEPYYPKLTPRAMLEVFDYADALQITLPDHPPECQLQLSDRQLEILHALGLHDSHQLLNH